MSHKNRRKHEVTGKGNFLRTTKIAKKLDISLPTYWRWIKAGRLPAPIKLGPNVTGSYEVDIDDCVAEIAERNSINPNKSKETTQETAPA